MNLSMIFFLLFNTKEDIFKNYGNPLTFFPILLKSTALKSKYLLLCSFGTTENSVMQLKCSVCMCCKCGRVDNKADFDFDKGE